MVLNVSMFFAFVKSHRVKTMVFKMKTFWVLERSAIKLLRSKFTRNSCLNHSVTNQCRRIYWKKMSSFYVNCTLFWCIEIRFSVHLAWKAVDYFVSRKQFDFSLIDDISKTVFIRRRELQSCPFHILNNLIWLLEYQPKNSAYVIISLKGLITALDYRTEKK